MNKLLKVVKLPAPRKSKKNFGKSVKVFRDTRGRIVTHGAGEVPRFGKGESNGN